MESINTSIRSFYFYYARINRYGFLPLSYSIVTYRSYQPPNGLALNGRSLYTYKYKETRQTRDKRQAKTKIETRNKKQDDVLQKESSTKRKTKKERQIQRLVKSPSFMNNEQGTMSSLYDKIKSKVN
jgi:hypothetical protein